MSPIRPLERADLPDVCRLYELLARSGSSEAPPELAGYFARTLLDHPWADPDIPSLVYTGADGEIVAFLGSHVRRLRLHGRPARMACSGQLVARADSRHRGAGALLMRKYLAGPQDLTITDGATRTVRLMWERLGGFAVTHASMGWTRVFRPWATSTAMLTYLGRRSLARSLSTLTLPMDAAARVLAGRRLLPAKPKADVEPLTVEEMLRLMPQATRAVDLHPDYDEDFLAWLFSELAAVDARGASVRHLVRDHDGQIAGWYVYFLAPGEIAQAQQIVALRGRMEPVLDHLFWHAARGGAVAVQGRLEPALLAALSSARCTVFSRTEWALAHSKQPEVLASLGGARALLTRLEGEWWMGHHLLWRDSPRTSDGSNPASHSRSADTLAGTHVTTDG